MAMRAVIFDFDGVLVDSEPLHFQAMRDSLAQEGIRITEEEYLRLYLAYDDIGAMGLALEEHGIRSDAGRVKALARRKAALFEEKLASIDFFPGVLDLVRALAEEVPIAIASGALRAEIEAVLGGRGLRGLFSAVVGADDVLKTKPDPEPYRAALSRLDGASKVKPAECVVVEDSPPGIAAGLAAGMRLVAVSNSYPPASLAAAHLVLPSLKGVTPDDLRILCE